jgi:hypothetical protein
MPTRLRWSLVLVVLFPGCGKSLHQVSGKVVFRHTGQPAKELKGYQVNLTAEDQPVAARGTIDENGSFQISTYGENDGALPGKHKVVIVPPSGDPLRQPKSILPKRYADPDKSGLEIVVPRDGVTNVILTVDLDPDPVP